MAGQYFYARGEQRFGPFSGTRMKELATSGDLVPTDTVWKHGMKKSVRAGRVQDLFPTAAAQPRPDDTAVTAAKAPSPVAAEPAPADLPEASAAPAETIKAPEPTLELVPIEEEQTPQASDDRADEEEKTIPVQAPNRAAQTPKRKPQAHAVRGVIIVSQDGVMVHYRKCCTKCGHQANSKNSMPIRNGSTTASFFCPKCKKLRDVVIRGSS
jgi:hypothetical protein